MRFGFYIAAILLVLSCRRELTYVQDKNIPDLPVVHAYICPDSGLNIVCRTLAGLLTEDQPISQALFELSQNSQFPLQSNYSGMGIHSFSNNPFKAGDSFFFAGLIGTGKSVFMRGKVPNKIKMTGLDTFRRPIAGVGMAFGVQLKFTDSAAYSNYYRVYFQKRAMYYSFDSADKVTDSTIKVEIIPVYSSSLPAVQNNFNNYTAREVLFSDATFNGVSQTMLLYTTDKLQRSRREFPLSVDVVVECIDKALYTYYNTRNAHLWQQQSISQIPGVVQGNLTGALGVVGAYTLERVRIHFK
jgi:hypothetical protein